VFLQHTDVLIAIAGLGLMGSSLALAVRAARPDTRLAGSDPDPATVAKALARGIVDEAGPQLDPERRADLVVLAAPIPALPELLVSLAGHPGVVTDLASTKVKVMQWAAAAGVDLVGGHPMCGRERSGIDAADPELFRAAPWILTRPEPIVMELASQLGARPLVMDAERHDRLVAGVSHTAFMLSIAYVLALSGSGDWADMSRVAGPGFRDMSRLAAGDPELYTAIVSTNREPLAVALREVEATIAKLRRHLEAGDARLGELFEEAKRVRDRWSQDAGER
jgi:prephenate dehydrogenase